MTKKYVGGIMVSGMGGRCRNYGCSLPSEYGIGTKNGNPGTLHFVCGDCLVGIIADSPMEIIVEALKVMDSDKLVAIINALSPSEPAAVEPASVIPPLVDPASEPVSIPASDPVKEEQPTSEQASDPATEIPPADPAPASEPADGTVTGGK